MRRLPFLPRGLGRGRIPIRAFADAPAHARRLPAIVDPNTGLTLWESGAIILYLVEEYDTGHTLSFPAGTREHHLAHQYLVFQVAGQGPYFGQACWFECFHATAVPSARARYRAEIARVTRVLDGVLADGRAYLVGGRCSYADLAFVPWYWLVGFIDQRGTGLQTELDAANPHWRAWMDRLSARPAVQRAAAERLVRKEAKQTAVWPVLDL